MERHCTNTENVSFGKFQDMLYHSKMIMLRECGIEMVVFVTRSEYQKFIGGCAWKDALGRLWGSIGRYW